MLSANGSDFRKPKRQIGHGSLDFESTYISFTIMQKKAQFKILLHTTTENGSELIEQTASGLCVVEEKGVMVTYPEPENEGHTQLIIANELDRLAASGTKRSRA